MNARLVVALALSLLPACGSSDPMTLINEGARALASGDHAAAAKGYERALDALGSDTSSPEWKRAKLGLIQALAQTDAPRAKTDFLEFAAANPGKVTDTEYSLVASRLGEAGNVDEAIEILQDGKARFPESLHLDVLGKDLLKRAKDAGNEGAQKELEGLGYTGGD